MSVLDPAAIENLREMVGGDVEFMIELIDVFLNDAPRMLSDMRQSFESGDAEVLHRAAHSLKSNAAEFGAIGLSDLCREIETLSKAGAVDGTDELVTRAKAEYVQVQAALEAARQGL